MFFGEEIRQPLYYLPTVTAYCYYALHILAFAVLIVLNVRADKDKGPAFVVFYRLRKRFGDLLQLLRELALFFVLVHNFNFYKWLMVNSLSVVTTNFTSWEATGNSWFTLSALSMNTGALTP